MRSIEQRTQFLAATSFSPEKQQEVERVLEWLTDFPDEAAMYIVWFESAQKD